MRIEREKARKKERERDRHQVGDANFPSSSENRNRKQDHASVRVTSVLIPSRARLKRGTRNPNTKGSKGKRIYRAAGAWPRWRSARHQRGGPCRSFWTARRPPSRRWCSRRSPSRALAGDRSSQHVVMTIMMMTMVVFDDGRREPSTDPSRTPIQQHHAQRIPHHRTVQATAAAAVAVTSSSSSWHLLHGRRRVGTARTRSRSHTRTRRPTTQHTYNTLIDTSHTRACVLAIAHAAARMRSRGVAFPARSDVREKRRSVRTGRLEDA